MPHFHTTHPQDFCLPLKSGAYEFVCKFTHTRNHNQSLILVRYEDCEFFLLESVRDNGTLYKYHKATRIDPIGIIKDALEILRTRSHGILGHNLSKNTPKQCTKSPFLLSRTQTYEFVLHHNKPLSIEVGFGSGRHLLDLATKNPNELFLGLEIHTPSIEQVLRQITLLGLTNLYISHIDARILLQLIPNASLKNIYVHFPVPWHKKPHRRVISPMFLHHAMRTISLSNDCPTALPQSGFLHVRTDDREYFDYTLQLVLALPKTTILVEKNANLAVVSKYEARWKKQEKHIFDGKIFSVLPPTDTQKSLQNGDFVFHGISEYVVQNIKNLIALPTLPKIVRKTYFLHIDAIYQHDENYVIALCLGDFDEPQNAFVLIQNGIMRYLNAPPLPTQAAIQAHQLFIHILESKDKH
ncbi:tRNA (guanosine(46)-N7)-methyltransferase TrmB [uncultured Helicobacter sp.]|uniref:tRNA (guanosine(46)-N7)-methyltransferase TrmB n=1 Tax=uncultured Helicobacter sp. TaxID=175537 RepID=UPI00374F76AC